MKRITLSKIIGLILIICMLALFVSGLEVMQSLQSSYLEMLYGRTQQLIKQALLETEERINAAKQTAYDIIVSDTTQTNVSGYLDSLDQGGNRAALLAWTDGITNSIATYLKGNTDVLCANYIDSEGNVKVVASRNYIRMNDEQTEYINSMAIAEDGGTILVQGKSIGMDDNMLLVVKQLREKRRLTMRHTGVVVLFCDMNELSAALTEAWEGTFLLDSDDMRFVLKDDGDKAFTLDEISEGYSLREYDGRQYFVLNISGKLIKRCVAVLPYKPIFATTKQLLIRHTLVYALCCTAIFALALICLGRATRDFGKLRKHLSAISTGDEGTIPRLSARGHSRDADELFNSFNEMARKINTLTTENYTAQLAVKDAQLAALQAQINPHFLYNTLNSIYWSAKSGANEQAAAMTQDLSVLLRDAVDTNETIVSMDRELEITISYISIQKQRYKERLNVKFDIDSDVSELAIPKFTIQPLIENAIKYGVEPSLKGGTVNVVIKRMGDNCVCEVKNEGAAPDPDLSRRIREGDIVGHGAGIGLVNIDKRIRAMFSDDCGVSIYRDESENLTVTRVTFNAINIDKARSVQK